MTNRTDEVTVSDISAMVDALMTETDFLYMHRYGSRWPFIPPNREHEYKYMVKCLEIARDTVAALEQVLQSERFESLERFDDH